MEHLIQHFRKEEQPFIERVIEWQRDVEFRYENRLTDFLDPREQFIVSSIVGQNSELSIHSTGLFKDAERKRMIISPSYFQSSQEDFEITIFQVRYPSKFIQLRHKDVLGALLSLGINRSKFGDIKIADDTIQFAVASDITDYLLINLSSIGKSKVHLELLSNIDGIIQSADKWVENTFTISSMRLDAILATMLKISREKAKLFIQGGKVKVNWAVRESTSFELQEGDIISVSGFGRFKIIMTEGRTKKDKIRLKIGHLVQK